ncbi:MAG: hypothetical protein Greene07147_614 [Parcubacteria group bacterium Greene0714_7]|nr:MAG: hypothetical protein Greene07147_614 [Parcubacteria group bacterium Greene0714_7]
MVLRKTMLSPTALGQYESMLSYCSSLVVGAQFLSSGGNKVGRAHVFRGSSMVEQLPVQRQPSRGIGIEKRGEFGETLIL